MLDQILDNPWRAGLAPVLLYQGRKVRARTLKLPEPPGERVGLRGAGPSLRLLMVGDSSAAGVGVAHQDEALLGQLVARLAQRFAVQYRLEARNGATLAGSLRHLRGLDAQPFDVVVVVLGVNDVTAGVPLAAWLASYRALLVHLRTAWRVKHIIVSGMPPVDEFPALPQPLRWVLGRSARRNEHALAALASAQDDVNLIGFQRTPDDPDYDRPIAELMAADGFHPGAIVYSSWAQRLHRCIAQRLNYSVGA